MNTKKLREHAPYILAMLVLTSVYFFQFFNEKLPARDIAMGYLPNTEMLKISALEYKDFWPLWVPYGFSGTPFLMEPLPGLDNLLGLLTLTIPHTVIALKLNYVILFFISGVSMYMLMTYLNIDKKFAFISALIYMLNGYMVKLLVWGWGSTLGGYALLPLAFMYGIKAIKEKKVIKNSVITGIIFAILFRFNQDMKVTMWLGILYGLYLLFNLIINPSKQRLAKTMLVSCVIFLVFFGLSAQRMVPNMDYIKVTSRGETTWESSSGRQLQYKDMFNRLIEPIYKGMPKIQRSGTGDHIGLIAFFLVVFAIYKQYKNKNVIFFSIAALFSIFVATNTLNLYYLLWRFIPFFKSLRYMDRSLFLFGFSCSILAGVGVNEFFKNIKNKRSLIYSILVILILTNLWLFNFSHYSGKLSEWTNVNEAIKSNYILQYLSKERQKEIFRIQTWETRGIDWGTDFYNVPLRLEHIYRYDTIWYPPYFNEYLSISYNNPAKLWSILNLKYVTSQTELNISGFKFVKKFENCTVCFPSEPKIQKAWGPYLYENELFLPRAYTVNNSILVVGEQDSVTQTIYALMLNPNFKPYNTAIIRGKKSINEYETGELAKYSAIFLTKGSIDQNAIFKLQQYVNMGGALLPDVIRNKNSVSENDVNDILNSFKGDLNQIDDENIIMHNFDKREIKLNGQKGLLVYSEKFSVFDGWDAKDKKKEKLELLNVDAMISAVYLKGNEDTLIFNYNPKSYKIGSTITIITIILLISFFIFRFYRLRKKSASASET